MIIRILLSCFCIVEFIKFHEKNGRMLGKASHFAIFHKVRLVHLICLLNLMIYEHLSRISVHMYADGKSHIIFITKSWFVCVSICLTLTTS